MIPYLITYSPFLLLIFLVVGLVLLLRGASSGEVRVLPDARNRYPMELWRQDDPPLSITNPATPQDQLPTDFSLKTDQGIFESLLNSYTDTTNNNPEFIIDFTTDPGSSSDFSTDVGCANDSGSSFSPNSDN